MFNIEQELETSFGETISSIIADDNCITAHTTGGTYRFHRKTGILMGHENEVNPYRLRLKCGTKPKDIFNVYTGRQDWAKDSWVKVPFHQFDTGTQAAAEVKTFNRTAADSDSPYRFRVQKDTIVAPDQPWREWMRQRFVTGEYLPLPWAAEPWAYRHPDHFAHADDAYVGYITDGPRDIRERMSPGRYLERYYSDVLTPTQIQQWATKVDVECDLLFTDTADGIERVYLAGPNSCMKHPLSAYHHALPHHPVRVYAGGDLSLAYLERRGKIVARALCWPKKKVHSRIYGDIDRMKARLANEGYTEDWGALSGARLALTKDDMGRIVMPYIDSGCASLCNGKLYLDNNGEIDASRTDGWAGNGDETYGYDDDDNVYACCEYCDSNIYDSDNAYSVGNQIWCNNCYEIYSSECSSCYEQVADSDTVTVFDNPQDRNIERDVCRHCATHNYHAHNGEYFETLEVEVVEEAA